MQEPGPQLESDPVEETTAPGTGSYAGAESRLRRLAIEYNLTIDELLSWYSDPMDMADIARFTREQCRQSVEYYILDQKGRIVKQ